MSNYTCECVIRYCWVYVCVWCGNADTDNHWLSRTRSHWSAWSIIYRRTRINGPQNELLMLKYDNSKKNAIWTTVLRANDCSTSALQFFNYCFTDLQLLLYMLQSWQQHLSKFNISRLKMCIIFSKVTGECAYWLIVGIILVPMQYLTRFSGAICWLRAFTAI